MKDITRIYYLTMVNGWRSWWTAIRSPIRWLVRQCHHYLVNNQSFYRRFVSSSRKIDIYFKRERLGGLLSVQIMKSLLEYTAARLLFASIVYSVFLEREENTMPRCKCPILAVDQQVFCSLKSKVEPPATNVDQQFLCKRKNMRSSLNNEIVSFLKELWHAQYRNQG